ncbi:MAG: hypothetical protein AAFX06_24290 [Planctomycetota bacterium]
MNEENMKPDLDAVVEAFMMEEDTGRKSLERYLQLYPQFAVELLDVAREISAIPDHGGGTVSDTDERVISAAWKRHVETVPGGATDPLGLLQPSQLNQLSAALNLPRQVFSALRERRVIASSISEVFLQSLAEQINCSIERLVASLNESPRTATGVSRKSEVKPAAPQKVTFEQILKDAEIEPHRVTELISGN